jgi:hypothetical protein
MKKKLMTRTLACLGSASLLLASYSVLADDQHMTQPIPDSVVENLLGSDQLTLIRDAQTRQLRVPNAAQAAVLDAQREQRAAQVMSTSAVREHADGSVSIPINRHYGAFMYIDAEGRRTMQYDRVPIEIVAEPATNNTTKVQNQ